MSSYGPVGRREPLTRGIVTHSGGLRRGALCFCQPARRDLETAAMFFSSRSLLYPPNLVLIKLKGDLLAPPGPSKVPLHLVTRLPFPYSLCPSSKLVGGDIQPGCPKATGDLKLCPKRRRGEKRHYYAEELLVNAAQLFQVLGAG